MTLVSKISAASKDVGGKLTADKTNKDQGYDYLSADKILTVCGQALAGQGIALFPAITEMSAEAVTYLKTWKGGSEEKTRYDARVQFLMKLSDGEDTQDLLWYGLGSDYAVPDKAVYKAITSGHKYFLMKLLNVGAGNEDDEHEASEEVKVIKQPSQQRPQSSGQVWPVAGVSSNGNGAKPPARPHWNSVDEAVLWGMDQGAFKAIQHAQNAYNKLRDEAKASDNPPKSAKDMFDRWFADVLLRLERAKASIITDAELDGTDMTPAVVSEGDEPPLF